MEGGLECPICYDTVPPANAMSLCKSGHRLCSDCAWRCCESALSDGLVPACPFNKESKCGAVSQRSAVAALNCWLDHEQSGRVSREKLDSVYLSAERAASGAVQCIGKNGKPCAAFYIPPVPHSSGPQRMVCTRASCGVSFCSACRQPFHFRSSCAAALRISARWIRFLQAELVPFLRAAVVLDGERWAPVLQRHAKAKGALDEATRQALARFDECASRRRSDARLPRSLTLSLTHHPHPYPHPYPRPGCGRWRCGRRSTVNAARRASVSWRRWTGVT